MSGGGRQNWQSKRESDIGPLFNESTDITDNKFYDSEVEQLFTDILKDINAHDYEAIQQHRRAIADALTKEFEDIEILTYGGSHSRHTDVVNLSDIDILVTLGTDGNLMFTSRQVLTQFATRLRERFPHTDVTVGKMAVTLKYSDGIEVQILPTYRSGNGYKIPDPNSSHWITCHPVRFANQLTSVNQKNNGRVIPIIKLAKKLCSDHNIGLKSYHIENIALHAFEHYSDTKSYPKMLRHLFNYAKGAVHHPMSDPSGQSNDISAYLTLSSRKQISHQLNQLEISLLHAMQSKSINRWRNMF